MIQKDAYRDRLSIEQNIDLINQINEELQLPFVFFVTV